MTDNPEMARADCYKRTAPVAHAWPEVSVPRMFAYAFEVATRSKEDRGLGRREAVAEAMLHYLWETRGGAAALTQWLQERGAHPEGADGSRCARDWSLTFQRHYDLDTGETLIADGVATCKKHEQRVFLEFKVGDVLKTAQIEKYLAEANPQDKVVAIVTTRSIDQAVNACVDDERFSGISWNRLLEEVRSGTADLQDQDCWEALAGFAEKSQFTGRPLQCALDVLQVRGTAMAFATEWQLLRSLALHGYEMQVASSYAGSFWIQRDCSGSTRWGLSWEPDGSGWRPLNYLHRATGTYERLSLEAGPGGPRAKLQETVEALATHSPAWSPDQLPDWPDGTVDASRLVDAICHSLYDAIGQSALRIGNTKDYITLSDEGITFAAPAGRAWAVIVSFERWRAAPVSGPVYLVRDATTTAVPPVGPSADGYLAQVRTALLTGRAGGAPRTA